VFDYMYISTVGHVKRFIMLNAFFSGLGNETSAFECNLDLTLFFVLLHWPESSP
jgi:hypothetical protein